MNNKDKIILALDFPSQEQTLATINSIGAHSLSYVKVGMELFYSCGPSIIQQLKELDLKIFLDIKMHDIPHTVTAAARSLANLKVDMINLHVAGGFKMMKEANSAYKEIHPSGKVIAVTQLTSTNQAVSYTHLPSPRDPE